MPLFPEGDGRRADAARRNRPADEVRRPSEGSPSSLRRLCGIRDTSPMILGLDLSLTGTGVTLLCPDVPEIYESVTLKNKLRSMERLAYIESVIMAKVQEAGVKTAALEGYAFSAMDSQKHSLGELGGIVKLALWRAGVEMIIVPATTLKKWATTKGNADKILMGVSIFKQTGAQFEDDNQADSYCLAMFAAQYKGYETPFSVTADRRKLVEQVRANPLCLPTKN